MKLFSLMTLALTVSLAACGDPDKPCGDDFELTDQGCVSIEPSGCDYSTQDTTGAGDACTDGTNHTDCTGAADYCAISPGAATGYCTFYGCVDDECMCPEAWSCFDLTGVSPGLSFCQQ